ncbi:phytanoyl-CoA dioxygenase family protein [Actinomadura sp. 3N508]|uniref:phytanoyl-CoA dioxygenase family protein n=1 Tax=Actinomadura sp. 3N508 TaxID=3375153 RepID=UPI0037B86520
MPSPSTPDESPIDERLIPDEVPRFGPPYDWAAIDTAVLEWGAAVVGGLVERELRDRVNQEVDAWLTQDREESGLPHSGTPAYDTFLGFRTVRLLGLATRFPSARELIAHEQLLAWGNRMLAPLCRRILLNSADIIQIGPRETPQIMHRDTDGWWPELLHQEHPVGVTAMLALTPFTAENGATRVVPGSHRWPLGRRATRSMLRPAIMAEGDVLLFRDDVVHAGGGNRTRDQYRRGCAVSYCVGWLRQRENGTLVAPPDVAADLPVEIAELLGYAAHDTTSTGGGLIGMYDNGDPRVLLRRQPAGRP